MRMKSAKQIGSSGISSGFLYASSVNQILSFKLVHTNQLALVLALTLTFQNNAFAFLASDAHKGSSQGNKVKTEIQRYDTAKKTQLKVTLRSGNELKGYVSRSDDVSFDLAEKNGCVSKLSYEDVDKAHGAGLSRDAKIAIVVGSAVAVVAAVFAIEFKRTGFGRYRTDKHGYQSTKGI
jgi:hypothetical protein